MHTPNYLLPLWRALVAYVRRYPPLVQDHGTGTPEQVQRSTHTNTVKRLQVSERPACGSSGGLQLCAARPRVYW